FWYDRVAKQIKLVSVNRFDITSDNKQATITDSPQTDGRFISDNGRYVVFQSNADDLVANDHNGVPDVFVRDMVNNTTTLVSVNANGVSGFNRCDHPVISADGRYVAYDSSDGNVYVRDLVAKTTKRVNTVASGAGGGSGGSILPKISYD